MFNTTVLRAASRLSSRMFAYHLKRAFRNWLARKAPGAYRRYIDHQIKALPRLRITGSENVELARKVATFYAPEYRSYTEDATKGSFTFFGQHVDFGSPDRVNWHATVSAEQDFHLWRMKLAHMGFVCPMLIDRKPHQWEAVGQLISGYKRSTHFNEPRAFTSYLFPYSVSHRILAILSGYIIAQSEGGVPEPLAAQLEEFLHWNAGFVLGNIEHELKNNHVERNLAALCLYLDALDDLPASLIQRLDQDVRAIIEACILPDGLLVERSAMYQGLAVMALTIFAETQFLSPTTRTIAQTRLEAARRAWAIMTHPDGEIALFNDSWWGEVPPMGHVVDPPALKPLECLEHAGYARLENNRLFALFDAGPIGPRWNPGHGHGDFLSVEIDLCGSRFIVDPGTFQYSTGPRRHFERAAQSHNGPCWTDINPVDYQGCFKVGRMAEAHLTEMESPAVTRIAGELPLWQGTLSRVLNLEASALHIKDTWSNHAQTARVTLIIQGDWVLDRYSECDLVFKNSGQQAAIMVSKGRVGDVRSGTWARRYLQSEPATVIVLHPHKIARASSAILTWAVNVGPIAV